MKETQKMGKVFDLSVKEIEEALSSRKRSQIRRRLRWLLSLFIPACGRQRFMKKL